MNKCSVTPPKRTHPAFRPDGVDGVHHGLLKKDFVEEHQGIHGLVLCGRGNIAIDRQVTEKGFDLGFAGKQVVPGLHPAT